MRRVFQGGGGVGGLGFYGTWRVHAERAEALQPQVLVLQGGGAHEADDGQEVVEVHDDGRARGTHDGGRLVQRGHRVT